jgi:hypothetical protein
MPSKHVSLVELRHLCRLALAHGGLLAAAACAPAVPPDPPEGVGPTGEGTPTGIAEPPSKSKDCKVGESEGHGCAGFYVVLQSSREDCDIPAEGPIATERCKEFCGEMETSSCEAFERDGKPAVSCNSASTDPCLGRRPAGARRGARRTAGVSAYLHRAMRLEARSVDAFHELGVALSRWGAPASLLRACRRAAADEARHAEAMAGLLRRRGERPRRLAPRRAHDFTSLEVLARHNEREGVVGETWAALLAAHQAEHAADASVRRAMRAIAREELEHAALSFRIARWARSRLGAEAAERLDATRRDAFARLQRGIGPFPATDADSTLGWPTAARARAMAEVLHPIFA